MYAIYFKEKIHFEYAKENLSLLFLWNIVQ